MQILTESALTGALAPLSGARLGLNWNSAMFVITNRSIEKSGTGLDQVGKKPTGGAVPDHALAG